MKAFTDVSSVLHWSSSSLKWKTKHGIPCEQWTFVTQSLRNLAWYPKYQVSLLCHICQYVIDLSRFGSLSKQLAAGVMIDTQSTRQCQFLISCFPFLSDKLELFTTDLIWSELILWLYFCQYILSTVFTKYLPAMKTESEVWELMIIHWISSAFHSPQIVPQMLDKFWQNWHHRKMPIWDNNHDNC